MLQVWPSSAAFAAASAQAIASVIDALPSEMAPMPQDAPPDLLQDAREVMLREFDASVLRVVLDAGQAQQIVDDGERRRVLLDRFIHAQKFAQIDPWAERANGKDAHEFAPVADLTLREAAE